MKNTMRPITFWAYGSLFLMLTACGQKESVAENTERSPSASPASNQNTRHSAGWAVSGSHADWCGEHQVPESLCTRCNSSLIPAFKATGDWCNEHGLPESQCLACNPDLKIVRPPRGAEDGR